MLETCTAMTPTADSWALLRSSSISELTPLGISRELLPKIPGGQDLPDLMDCRAQAGDDQTKLMECMLPKLASKEQIAQLNCAQKATEEEIYACVRATITDQEAVARLDCLKAGAGAAGGWEKCLVPPEASAAVESVTACTTTAKSQDEFATKCLSMLTNDDKALRTARCTYEAGTDRAAALRCLAGEDEGVSKVLGVVECVDAHRDDRVALTKCLASKGGGATAAAACLSDFNVDPLSCIGTLDPKAEQAQRIYSCAKAAGDVALDDRDLRFRDRRPRRHSRRLLAWRAPMETGRRWQLVQGKRYCQATWGGWPVAQHPAKARFHSRFARLAPR